MREIKFRAWEKAKERMLYEIGLNYIDKMSSLNLNQIFDSGYFVWQQFTGLKDKNGKEIYEGDIVRTMMHYADDYGNPVDGQEKIFAVKWVESEGQQYVGLSLFPCDDIHKLEIIGNIYENSDLLK